VHLLRHVVKCSYRFAVKHSNKLFEVSSICLDKFPDSFDQRTCKLTKHSGVVDASCSAENSLGWFFSRVHPVCIHYSFHVTPTHGNPMGSDPVTVVANSVHRHDQSIGLGIYDSDTV